MRNSILVIATCFSILSTQTQAQTITLPRDNGETVSFFESMNLGREAKAFYDTACVRLTELVYVNSIIVNGEDVTACMQLSEMQQGIFGKIILSHNGRYVNYCVYDFHVNGQPLDDWLSTANATVREQVKARIFSNTVMLVASIKGNGTTSLTQR